MMNKMMAWIIGNGVPTKENPMLSQFSYFQAKAIANNKNITVIYIALDLRSIRRKRPYRAVYKKDNMEIVYWSLFLGAVPRKLMELGGYAAAKSALKFCKKKYGEPDIIHTHFCEIGYNISRNKNMFPNCKFVHTEHWSALARDNVLKENRKIANYTYHMVDKVIAVSKPLSERIKRDYGIDSLIIPNMVDDTLFNIEGVHFRDNISKQYNFISVGRLTYQKNHEGLIVAFSKAFNKDEHVKLSIVGDGADLHTLEKLIKKLGREEDIVLLGQKNHNEIALLLKKSDCFVLNSRFETFGVVYIEANMCGLPAIATRCGGPESIIDDSNGIVVDCDDEKELIDALKYMREHSKMFDRKKISSVSIDRYSRQSVTNKIISVYRELL